MLLLGTVLLAPLVHAQDGQLPPVDEAAGDVSWLRFKKQLMNAIEKKDKQFLLSILDRNVRNQDERTRGIATFRKQWELDTVDTPVWRELGTALQLGSAYMKRDKGPRGRAPYLLGRWPGDLNPISRAVAISRELLVQSEPSNTSSALGKLSYRHRFGHRLGSRRQGKPESEMGAHTLWRPRWLRAGGAGAQPDRAGRVFR